MALHSRLVMCFFCITKTSNHNVHNSTGVFSSCDNVCDTKITVNNVSSSSAEAKLDALMSIWETMDWQQRQLCAARLLFKKRAAFALTPQTVHNMVGVGEPNLEEILKSYYVRCQVTALNEIRKFKQLYAVSMFGRSVRLGK